MIKKLYNYKVRIWGVMRLRYPSDPDSPQIATFTRMVTYLAQFVSRILGPFSTVIPFLVYLLSFHTGLTPRQKLIAAPVLLVTLWVVPVVWFTTLWSWRKIADVDITDRRERNQWLNWVAVSSSFGLGINWLLAPSPTLLRAQSLLVLVILAVTLVTLKRKVSLHIAVLTSAFILVNWLFGWQFWWLVSLIGLVSWSRLVLKKHTPTQLVLGVAIPVGIAFLTLSV